MSAAPSLADRLAGGLVGLLVGDALGVPYEFQHRDDLPARRRIDYEPPEYFRRSHDAIEPGTWSDDGAQALCLLASLLECDRFDPDDFARRLLRWYDHGYMAVGNLVFDVGVTTGNALQRLRAGAPPLEAGSDNPQHNGNGALMRVLPLALWHRGSDAELVRDAQSQSRLTHRHPRSQVCCALYCLWARRELAGAPEPWREAVAALRELYPDPSPEHQELEWSIRPDDEPVGHGSGYVVDCLRSARMANLEADYENAVRSAVLLGNDTDTTATVTGGIAGIRYGVEGIPARWREKLRGQKLYQPLLEALLVRNAGGG